MGLDFHWAEWGDHEEFLDFLITTYGPDSIQALPGRAKWLYFENPSGTHVTLCRQAGKIVAACGHLPQPVHLGGRPIMAGFGVDFMVSPEWRRRGIGRRFLEMRLERFPLALSIGQSEEMSALYQSCEGKDLGPMCLGIFRRHPSRRGNPKSLIRDSVAWMTGLRGYRPLSTDSCRPLDWDQAKKIQATLQANGKPGPAEDPQGARWFQWRFSNSIYGDYRCLAEVRDDRPQALAVSRNDDGCQHIIHLSAGSQDPAGALAAFARSSPLPETRFLFTGTDLSESCRRAGFLIRRLRTRLVAMTTDQGLQQFLIPGSLDLTAGSADADLLRKPGPATAIEWKKS